jgi:hypothetical protein
MIDAFSDAKARFNTNRYSQIKVSVKLDIAAAFKVACKASEVSMASVLSSFMANYAQTAIEVRPHPDPYTTRKQRRRLTKQVINQLEQLLAAEERYRDNIPENLQNSIRYENAEECINTFEEAITLLEQAY